MSSAYPVHFKEVLGGQAPTQARISLANKILESFDKRYNWIREPEDFVFRAIPTYRPTPGAVTVDNVVSFYQTRLGVQRSLEPYEFHLCELLEEAKREAVDNSDFIRIIALVFELLVYQNKVSINGVPSVIRNAKVEVAGVVVDYIAEKQTYVTIDVAVDQLDTKQEVELCECALSLYGMIRNKDSQISFYIHVLEEISKVVPRSVNLKIELHVAGTSGRRWHDLNIYRSADAKRIGIKIEGITLEGLPVSLI